MNDYDINTVEEFINYFASDISNDKLFDTRLERAIEREVASIVKDYSKTNETYQFLTINWKEIAAELGFKDLNNAGPVLDRIIPAIVKEIIQRYNPTTLFPENRKPQLSEKRTRSVTKWVYLED